MIDKQEHQPNIIVLILDAVRARHMSCYGYCERTTPCLDDFAAQNLLFKHAFSPANWTIPTHASLLTGLYPSQHGIESVEADRCFNQDIVTLPDALKIPGYRTAAFSQNPLFGSRHHFDGFDEFYELDCLLKPGRFTRLVQRLSDTAAGLSRIPARYVRKMMGSRILLNALIDWIEAKTGRSPSFVMANLTTAHYRWAPPLDILVKRVGLFGLRHLLNEELSTLKPFEFNSGKRSVNERHRRFWKVLYDAALVHLDREVGRFLGRIRHWDGWDNTILIVMSDHGEMLGDYRGIVGHTLSLHDNLIHVPLIIHHPSYKQGCVVNQVVQTLDLYTSILEWTGVPVDMVPPAQLQRPSLEETLKSPGNSKGLAFAEEDYTDSYDVIGGLLSVNPRMNPRKYPRRQVAVRSATHKYVWFDDRLGEFYDLVSDPGEERNLIHIDDCEEKAILRELQEALCAWQSSLEIFPPRLVDADVDPVVLDRLRVLGYIA